MATDDGVQILHRAVVAVATGDASLRERLQRSWHDHVQLLWQARHLDPPLQERFKAMWEEYTGPGEDPHRTDLREMSEPELGAAVATLVALAMDAAADRAAEVAGGG